MKRVLALLTASLLLTTPALAAGVQVVVEPYLKLGSVREFEPSSNRAGVLLPDSEELVTAVVENGTITLKEYEAPAPDQAVLTVYKDPATGLYGYTDASGRVVIPCEYDWYIDGEFQPEYTAVPVQKGAAWGLVDRTGTLLVPCRYQMINRMLGSSDYFSFVELGDVTGKWGLMDLTGKVLLPAGEYSGLDGMMRHNGQWYVRAYRGGWGESKSALLDLEGKVFVPFEYSSISDYHNGMVAVSQDGKWGFLGPDGKLAVPCIYDEVRNFEQGRAAVGRMDADNRWQFGFIDKTGKEVIPLIYEGVGTFNEAGVTYAASGLEECHLIDRSGKVLTQKPYANISDQLEDGLLTFCVFDSDHNSLYGYLNQYGQEVIPAKFDFAQNFMNGLAPVYQNDKRGIIDVTGNFLLPPAYEDVLLFTTQQTSIWITKDGLYGVATVDYSTTGQPATSTVLLGDKEVSLPAYTLQNGAGGVTCVKLRDAAALLTDTQARFNVTWDGSITIHPGEAYVPAGGELAPLTAQAATALPNRAPVLLDGAEIALDAYTFGQNNYVTLRDLGRILDFSVQWADGIITLDPTAPYWAD